jgi:hypothetical protein
MMIKKNKKYKFLLITLGIFFCYFYYNETPFLEDSSNVCIPKKTNQTEIDLGIEKTTSNYVTVVSVYYALSRSNHKSNDYLKWAQTMFASVRVPLIIFADSSSVNFLTQLITQNRLNAKLIITKTIWDVMRDLEVERNRFYIRNYMTKQRRQDPERRRNSAEMYAIWNLKSHFMNKSVHLNPFKSKFFIYTDMDAWRGRAFQGWPDVEFVRQLHTRLDSSILYGQVNEIEENRARFSISKDLIEGTFFAGSDKAIRKLAQDYYKVHDDFLDRKKFVGKDQTLMNYLTFFRSTGVVRLKMYGLKCPKYVNKWFFYQYYFAQPDEFSVCGEIDRFSLLMNSSIYY